MERLVNLGAKDGPWCSIRGIIDPVLHIKGLVSNVLLKVRMTDGTEYSTFYDSNGEYIVPSLVDHGRPDWVKLSSTIRQPSLICVVRPAKVEAA